jgi:hypothetical protein
MMTLEEMHGIFVGLLTDEEIKVFDRAVEEGLAYRAYEGAGGFMGLAKVRLWPPRAPRRADV